MIVLLSVMAILVAVLLMAIVLIQNPKGSGLNPSFQGISNQLLGARQTADFLEKATWYLAVAIVGLSIIFNLMLPSPSLDAEANESLIQEQVEALPIPQLPTPNPLEQSAAQQNAPEPSPNSE